MEKIMLNDLLRIDEASDDFKYGRITFNTDHIDEWLRRGEKEEKMGPDFSFWAKNTTGTKTHIHGKDMVAVAVQLDRSDIWLLATICKVTQVNFDRPCDRIVDEKYRKWFNRVIFRMAKRAQGYNFTLREFLDRCEVIEIICNLKKLRQQELLTMVL